MKPRDRLRIAMQKSGRLTEPAQELLARCGLKFRQSRDKLFCFGEGEPVDLLLVRDDDIPGLIAEGVCDLGIVGRNVLREFQLSNPEAGSGLDELRPLGFGSCRLSIALPHDEPYDNPAQLHGQRIATSYPGLLGDWLRTHNVDAKVVFLAGSVEIAPRLGTADAICDLVSSGATLVANQLREAAVIVESEAVLAGHRVLPSDERGEIAELLLRRLDGVIQVRDSRLILMQASREALPAITRLLPGLPIPTLTA
ncbi:ATP phosphoribosyltransferase, partial [Luteibacter sp.]|uniref:ATP phosphoribosyltransferase n=1 Tax=Luteibacter sp. TaxID=1886636 RepID=UPI003F7E77D8